jgi:divalent metal cation (Fe/Co/Zn/Cd) transporter
VSTATLTADDRLRIEARGLAVDQWSMLIFATAGIAAYLLSSASALILDALYSLISFFTAYVAGRVVRSVRRGPDRANPYGRGGQESLYVLFRSLILIGIIGAAVVAAVGELVTYFATGEGDIPKFGVVAVYCVLSSIGCFAIAAFHRSNLRKVGGQSSILAVEATAARNDGLIGASIAVSLGIVALIPQGTIITNDTFNIEYIADGLVVLALGLVLLIEPVRLLREQTRRLAGERMDPQLEAKVRALVDGYIARNAPGQYEVIDVFAVDHGGASACDICVTFPGSATLDELDELRMDARAELARVFPGMTVTIDFTRVPLHRQITPSS